MFYYSVFHLCSNLFIAFIYVLILLLLCEYSRRSLILYFSYGRTKFSSVLILEFKRKSFVNLFLEQFLYFNGMNKKPRDTMMSEFPQ